MNFLKNKKQYRGFSLLELIMAIGIFGIITSVATFSLMNTRSAARVEMAQKELATDIKLAQSYALQGKTQNSGGTMKTPCGYGVRFTNDTTYAVYFNFPPVGQICEDINSDANYRHYRSGVGNDSGTVYSKTLSYGAKLPTGTDYNAKDVYFTLPNGGVFYNGGSSLLGSEVSIDLTGNGKTRTVTVNETGLVTAEE